ncbi:hypothetical protein [Sphingobium yanoikuyae]|uniref:hypothetical protein n=1 Tax=Sphingobium yanoikuyae TaxID=13690 RepID=UPI0028DB3EEA|nr:hypothetical protein [Sphingobium yanoikuyae]
MMWRVLHAAVFAHWSLLLISLICDIAEHGELQKTASAAGHFSTGFVLYMSAALVATGASALRASWVERA